MGLTKNGGGEKRVEMSIENINHGLRQLKKFNAARGRESRETSAKEDLLYMGGEVKERAAIVESFGCK